jgi:hypothetical protein
MCLSQKVMYTLKSEISFKWTYEEWSNSLNKLRLTIHYNGFESRYLIKKKKNMINKSFHNI